jgi:hypothetical protein
MTESGWKNRPRNPAYDSVEYRKARAACLARATRCALGYPDICTIKPTQADHRLGIAADPHHRHLQAVCKPCHARKTLAESHAAANGKRTPTDPNPEPRTEW